MMTSRNKDERSLKLNLETKFIDLDFKSVASDGYFEGYASVFNRQDLGRDVIAPGAFHHSLNSRGASGIKMLFQHDPNQPIGVWDEIVEDSKGLFAKGHLLTGVRKAREVLALMRVGALDGLSIGFRALKGRRIGNSGIRKIEKVDLWEISVVTFPMLPEARVEAVKTRPFSSDLPTEREFERWLTRDAGLTRSEARAVMRGGLKSLKALRDAGGGKCEGQRLAEKLSEVTAVLRSN